jgi:hypothetical protein
MVNLLLRVSVLFGLCGMAMGIAMGIRQDFSLAPAHAHLNLLGFVTLFLSGLYYRVVPAAAASMIAKMQAGLAVAGAVIFPAGIASVLLGNHEKFLPIVVGGALTVLASMALLVFIVFRADNAASAS